MTLAREINIEILKITTEILEIFKKEFQQEIKQQGHVLTGKLLKSIEIKVDQKGLITSGSILIEDYGRSIETGIKRSRIPFGRKTGKKVSKYIQGLIRFFELRGLSTREAKGAAFATAHTQKREGMPTRASFRFSKNGARTGFIQRSVAKNEDKVVSIFQDKAAEIIQIKIEQRFSEIVKVFNRA